MLNPSGCDGKLFAWVETTFGAGSNGDLPGYTGTPGAADYVQTGTFATNYTTGETPAPVTTGEGSTALGFYNVQQGDAPYFKQLADSYAMSDNFHQSFQGGTGANHIMLGHGDALYFQDQNGNAVAPPIRSATRRALSARSRTPIRIRLRSAWAATTGTPRTATAASTRPGVTTTAAVPTATALTPLSPASDRFWDTFTAWESTRAAKRATTTC